MVFAGRIILCRILLDPARNEGVVGATGLQIDNGGPVTPGGIDLFSIIAPASAMGMPNFGSGV